MAIEMHENAIKKVKRNIADVINKIGVEKIGIHNMYDIAPFENIAKELNNRKNNYEIDSVSCFMILEKLRYPNNFDLSDRIKLNDFIDAAFDVYAKTPFEYCVKFNFENIDMTLPMRGFEKINSSIGEKKDSVSFPDKSDGYLVVDVKSSGYYTGTYPESFIKNATQELNVLIFLLISNEVITDNSYDISSPYFFSMNPLYKKSPIKIDVINDLLPIYSTSAQLPEPIEKYYSVLRAGDNATNLALFNAFDVANSIVNDKSKELLRIKSAIDWLVHSVITEDHTMSFIQACMGLESIFGDDDYEGGLTTVLSDRCAYLIGKNIKDRHEIKKTFKEIYQIRSKIIHGVRSFLSEKEKVMLYLARQFLRNSILKELGNLELLTESQQR